MTKIIILMLLLSALLFSAIGCSELSDDTNVIDDDSVVSDGDTTSEIVSENPDHESDEANEEEAVELLVALTEEDAHEIDQLIGLFIEYASTLDIPSQMDLFAADDYVDGYDIEVIAERMGVEPSDDMLENPTYESRLFEIDSMITRFFFGFRMFEEGIKEKFENNTLSNQDVLNTIIQTDYSTLSIKKIDNPTEKLKGRENLEKLKAMYSSSYGYENSDYRITLLELDGETFYCGFTLYKYNGKWSIFSLNCGGIVPVGAYIVTVPISEEEYDETLDTLDHSE